MRIRQLVLAPLFIVVGVAMAAGLTDEPVNDAGENARAKSANNEPGTQAQRRTAGSVAVEVDFSPYVDRDGTIRLPKEYRQKWSHLGSWAVKKRAGEIIHEMHQVYTQPETVVAFNRTGKFPDGAVLVKEVRVAEADQLTTGLAAWSGDIKVWFVMVKDLKNRFEGNEHWGDGWGWALFEAKDPTKNASVGYDTSCLSCHIPAEDSDWVYTYGYPDLKQAKQQ